MTERRFVVLYTAGSYSGTRAFIADDAEHAVNKAKSWVRREMLVPMYSASYEVIDEREVDHV